MKMFFILVVFCGGVFVGAKYSNEINRFFSWSSSSSGSEQIKQTINGVAG